uniref:Genome polyprotein n=1 Tax=Chaerephon bat flavivirus TaxID=3141861 RepID=A0AAU7E2J8_9FLAV
MEWIERFRTGGLNSMFKERLSDDTQDINIEVEDELLPGIYKLESKCFGATTSTCYGFVSRGSNTLIAPYHAVNNKPILYENRIIQASSTSPDSDVTTYDGCSIPTGTPLVGGSYVVRNPELGEEISLKCVAITNNGYGAFAHERGVSPMKGWSGLPITDLDGKVYGIYCAHQMETINEENVWVARSAIGVLKKTDTNWDRIVKQALDCGYANIRAGTSAGKTIGVSLSLLKSNTSRVIFLQPTRAMVENQYNTLTRLQNRQLGYVHKLKSVNPGANFVIMTYGAYLARLVTRRRLLSKLVVCDETHTLQAEVQVVRQYLQKFNITRIEMSATPDGSAMCTHSGYEIQDVDLPLAEADEETVDVCGKNISISSIRKYSRGGMIIFVPSIKNTTDIASRLKAKNIQAHAVNSKTVTDLMARQVLTAENQVFVATSCLESGVTVCASTVIDSGLSAVPSFDGGNYNVTIIASTQAEAMQRRGRVGRTKPGIYIKLHDAERMYDPYESTYPYVYGYCKALDIDVPTSVEDKLAGNAALSELLGTNKIKLQVAAASHADMLMVLQYMDEDGKVWRKFKTNYPETVCSRGTTPNLNFSDWKNHNGQYTPQIVIGEEFINTQGKKMVYTDLSMPIAMGIIGLSYMLSKLFKHQYTTITATKIVDYEEYVSSTYASFKTMDLSGKKVTILRPTRGYIITSSTSLLTAFTYEISNRNIFQAPITYQDMARVANRCGGVFEHYYNWGYFEINGFSTKSMMRFIGEPLFKVMDLREETTVPVPVTETPVVEIDVEGIKETVFDVVRDLQSNVLKIVRYTKDFINTNNKLGSFALGLLVPSRLKPQDIALSYLSGVTLGLAEFNYNYVSAFFGSFISSLFVSSPEKALKKIANGLLRSAGFATSVFFSTTLANFSFVSAPLMTQTTHIAFPLAIFTSAALVGFSLVDSSSLMKMKPMPTSNATTTMSAFSLAGLTTGITIGYITETIDRCREKRVEQVAGVKNSDRLIMWMEETQRWITTPTVNITKIVCVSSLFLLRPVVCLGLLTGGLLLNGLSMEGLQPCIDILPSMVVLSDAVSNGDMHSLACLALAPFATLICGGLVGYVCQWSCIAGTYTTRTYTSTENATQSIESKAIVANSGSYSTAALIDQNFKLRGRLLIIGEGAGGLSQYYNSSTAIRHIDSVCQQEHTIPSLTRVQDPEKFKLHQVNILHYQPTHTIDSVFVDIYQEDCKPKVADKIVELIDRLRPARVVSTFAFVADGYSQVYLINIHGIRYFCYINGLCTGSKELTLKDEQLKNKVEVYLPTPTVSIPARLPNLPISLRTKVAKTYDGPNVYTIGKVNVGISFMRENALRVNGDFRNRESLVRAMRGRFFCTKVTQASRMEDDFIRAIQERVNVRGPQIRKGLLEIYNTAARLCVKPGPKRTIIPTAKLSETMQRSGTCHILDSYQTIGEYLDSGTYKGLERDKIIWQMMPKYENRLNKKGDFPPPRIITASNANFRVYQHQILGEFNKDSLWTESNGEMPFFVMGSVIAEQKTLMEKKHNTPYVFYAGDVKIWDAMHTRAHRRILRDIFAENHTHPDLVREIWDISMPVVSITGHGECVLKSDGVNSGDVRTKMENDGGNAARDLAVISVCVGMPVEEVRKKIVRLVCGDDFIGVMPADWAKKVRKHYADVSKELGYPLKGDININHDLSKVDFCSHYWIKDYSHKGIYLPYRNRREIMERLMLQPTTSTVGDVERLDAKIVSYLLLYGHDPELREHLSDAIRDSTTEVRPAEFEKYGMNLGKVKPFKASNWTVIADVLYRQLFKVPYMDVISSASQRQAINM